MRIIELAEIRRTLVYRDVIHRMREALIANSRGECETPMPMHLDIPQERGEVHIKSSYRRGGRYFALKIASTFPGNLARGLPTGNGMMLLCSAETGEPVALLADQGHLTDVRTAAASAMVARALERQDEIIGVIGTGIQARLQALMHAQVLDLGHLCFWGRNPERVAEFQRDMQALLPNVEIYAVNSPAELAANARIVITCTPSREPLLHAADLQQGTLISAVGSDSPGKQELDPDILRRAALILVDSRRQCEKLGELQHAPSEWERAIEIGAFCDGRDGLPEKLRRDVVQASYSMKDRETPDGVITVCDFTGLGVEDLYIAEYCYERSGS
ncbi:MAG TPA: ornithine cyclodeaminase family protein [Bryobacteraceae bacterium]|nr:ornithine cyclodeaminase family protein [Bryobacteraceae bacterium]